MPEHLEPGPTPDHHEPTPGAWRLDHPDHGLLEVVIGTPASLRTVDPGFPVGGPAHLPAREGFVLMREGALVARHRKTEDETCAITADPPADGQFSGPDFVLGGPRITMKVATFGKAVRQVTFLDDDEVVHFDPPPGSAAEARLAAIEASPWKRVVYPIAGGLGQSGGALLLIVVVPLVIRILEKLWPDVDVPVPQIDLPNIPWPNIPWPNFDLPSVDVPWPDIDLPPWIEFLIEYSKVWVPVVLGIAFAIVAVRHARESRRTRQRWEAERAQRNEDR